MAGCLAGCRSDAVPWREGKFEGAFRVPGIMWAPGRIPVGIVLDQIMSHMSTAAIAGLTPPPHREWVGDDGPPIYFDGIDNSAYVTGKSPTSARNSFIYIDGEALGAVRADIGGDPDNPDLKIAWKYVWTAKDTWLGPEQTLGGIGAA